MAKTEGFIGNYRILVNLSSHPIGELYLVEHTFRSGPATLLQLWTTIELTSSEDCQTFKQKVDTGVIRLGLQKLHILDAGIDDQHPYLVASYTSQTEKALQKQFSFIQQVLQSTDILHPNDPHKRIEAFLRVFLSDNGERPEQLKDRQKSSQSTRQWARILRFPTGKKSLFSGRKRFEKFANLDLSSVVPGLRSISFSSIKDRLQSRSVRLPDNKWLRLALGAILLALLGWGLYGLYTIIPATAATVTIKPVTKTLNQLYTIDIYSNPANVSSSQTGYVLGRKISFTSQVLTKTVATSGRGHHAATAATGQLVYTNVHLNRSGLLEPGSMTSLSGVIIDGEGEVPISDGADFQEHAHADQPGSGGNIRAYDMNFQVNIVDAITRAQIGTAWVTNPQPFSGGTDAYDFNFVQQADIYNVVTPFSAQLTPGAHAKLVQQMQPGEVPVGDIQCSPNVTPNHKVNDQADNVTVKMSVTCTALVYNKQAMHNAAITAFQDDGVARFGRAYSVVGNILVGAPQFTSTSTLDLAQCSVQVEGVWSFLYTPTRQLALQNLIAGKPQSEALLLLGGREDIQHFTIATSQFPGEALPATPTNIKLVIMRVSGISSAFENFHDLAA